MIEINLQDRKRLTVREGIYGCQGEGIVREFGIDMSTLLYFIFYFYYFILFYYFFPIFIFYLFFGIIIYVLFLFF